jgi:hypothetical protein
MEGKKRSEQHLIDADGIEIFRKCLPRHWVLREYRPDYGLDFSIEVFADATKSTTGLPTYETLGEHLFVQLKSVSEASAFPLQLYGRNNVEKQRERLDTDLVGEMRTIRKLVDVPELVTVHRMGVGVPVLLVVADLATGRCYFVCLNDYVDKILVPRHEDFTAAASRTIHVPEANEIGDEGHGLTALRWYAKRAKLYSAFQRFVFQAGELEYANTADELVSMATYFATRIVDYDFWGNTEMWGVIAHYGAAVKRFLATGAPGLMSRSADRIIPDESIDAFLHENDIRVLWKSLALLSRNYEDVCREWFLPTALGYMSSYRGAPIPDQLPRMSE